MKKQLIISLALCAAIVAPTYGMQNQNKEKELIKASKSWNLNDEVLFGVNKDYYLTEISAIYPDGNKINFIKLVDQYRNKTNSFSSNEVIDFLLMLWETEQCIKERINESNLIHVFCKIIERFSDSKHFEGLLKLFLKHHKVFKTISQDNTHHQSNIKKAIKKWKSQIEHKRNLLQDGKRKQENLIKEITKQIEEEEKYINQRNKEFTKLISFLE
jgi:hypothetical protein